MKVRWIILLLLFAGCVSHPAVRNVTAPEDVGYSNEELVRMGKVEIIYYKPVDFYVNGSFAGHTRLILVNESPEVNVCIDEDLDGACDFFYTLNKTDMRYHSVELHRGVGLKTKEWCSFYNSYVLPDSVGGYLPENISASPEEGVLQVWYWLRERFNYTPDNVSSPSDEYWQFPNVTLETRRGDCEDWSTAFLSLVKSVFPDSHCYAVEAKMGFGHVFVVCRLNGTYHLFDQSFRFHNSDPEELVLDFRGWWNDRKVRFRVAFNGTDCHWFSNESDFYSWLRRM